MLRGFRSLFFFSVSSHNGKHKVRWNENLQYKQKNMQAGQISRLGCSQNKTKQNDGTKQNETKQNETKQTNKTDEKNNKKRKYNPKKENNKGETEKKRANLN